MNQDNLSLVERLEKARQEKETITKNERDKKRKADNLKREISDQFERLLTKLINDRVIMRNFSISDNIVKANIHNIDVTFDLNEVYTTIEKESNPDIQKYLNDFVVDRYRLALDLGKEN